MQRPAVRPGDLAAALARLPLFPLPEMVLFPGALMPLHVFEPRYRAMVRDVLESHRVISVVMITDAGAVDAHGHPAIAGVAGAGEIIEHVELPGGRFNILLRGRARVRLEELPFDPPYRTARATVLPDDAAAPPADAASTLLAVAASFAAVVRARDASFKLRLPRDASPGVVADLCAHQLVLDSNERQVILETVDVGARILRVTEAIAMQRVTIAADEKTLN